jgi:hypothetical protein
VSLLRLALSAALVLAVLLALAWLAQRRLLYFPARYDLAAADGPARRLRLEPWNDRAGSFAGWRSPHPSAAPVARAVVLHGNAGSALDRTYLRDVLQAPGLPPIEVILLEYPGYGPRPGAPTEASILAAVTDALDQLGPGLPVLLVGESLGSAAAALAAAERPGVAGVLLLTPVASITSLARRHYPFAPPFLVRDAFRADRALPRYPGPVAFLVAGRDEVAFPDLARDLFAARAGPKLLREQPDATHNDVRYLPGDPVWADVTSFLLRYTPSP